MEIFLRSPPKKQFARDFQDSLYGLIAYRQENRLDGYIEYYGKWSTANISANVWRRQGYKVAVRKLPASLFY